MNTTTTPADVWGTLVTESTTSINWIADREAKRRERYKTVLEAEDRMLPEGRLQGYVEVDEWVPYPTSLEVLALLDGMDGDFADAEELHQRLFLLLAAEVLYGPHHDAVLLADAVMGANEPV